MATDAPVCSGRINFEEFEVMLKRIKRLFPTSQLHVEKVRSVFEKYDADKNGSIGVNELADMFAKISSRLTALPAVGICRQIFTAPG